MIPAPGKAPLSFVIRGMVHWAYPLLGQVIRRPPRERQTRGSDRLLGLVVEAAASRAQDPGFESRLLPDFFRGRVILVT